MKRDFEKVIAFIIELEKLKGIVRKSKPVHQDRYENSAEHSWQVALLALSLAPSAPMAVDGAKVVKMLLIHDVVEIDTGDKIIYSNDHDNYEEEQAAAQRLFGMLPAEIGEDYLLCWEEFETRKSPEAVFARAMDRLMPVLQNLNNQGQTWVENRIALSQVLEKNVIINDAYPEIWTWLQEAFQKAVSKGYLQKRIS